MKFKKYIIEERMIIDNIEDAIYYLRRDCKPFIDEMKKAGFQRSPRFFYRGTSNNKHIGKRRVRDDREPKDMPYETHQYLDDQFKRKYGWFARSASLFCTGSHKEASHYGPVYIIFPVGKFDILYHPQIMDLYSHLESNGWLELQPNPYDMDDYMYYEQYDEGMEGHWEWEDYDVESSDSSDASREIAERWVDDNGWDDWDDYDDAVNDMEGKINSEIKWVPDMDLDTWKEQRAEELERETMDEIDGAIRGYKKNRFKDALTSHNEVMINCKEYYFIRESTFENDLKKNWDKLFRPQVHPGQLKLPFGKKR